jgi:hypothetical protein
MPGRPPVRSSGSTAAPRPDASALRLIESVTYPNGMLQLGYETTGTPTYGQKGQKGSPEVTSE